MKTRIIEAINYWHKQNNTKKIDAIIALLRGQAKKEAMLYYANLKTN